MTVTRQPRVARLCATAEPDKPAPMTSAWRVCASLRRRAALNSVGRWGHVALRGVRAFAKEMLFHLAGQVLAGAQIGQVQAVFIDQHGLVLHPQRPGFLADVVVAWEAAAKPAEKHTRVAYARTGLVLGKKGALGPLRLLTSLFASGPLAGGKDWWPWISLHDEARALAYLIENNISGPVNLVAPTPATSGTVMKALARLMKRPYWLPAPGFAISLLLGQAGRELLLSSQKITPEVLLSSGFTFADNEIEDGLHSALR